MCPRKGALTVFFYREALTDAEMDAVLANAARFDAGDAAKGPGVGKRHKSVRYVFKAWTRAGTRPGETAGAEDFVKNVFYSSVCENEAVVRPSKAPARCACTNSAASRQFFTNERLERNTA